MTKGPSNYLEYSRLSSIYLLSGMQEEMEKIIAMMSMYFNGAIIIVVDTCVLETWLVRYETDGRMEQ